MTLPTRDSQLVQIVDAALAEAARKAGDWLVCKPGCTPCCYGAFTIDALDAQRLRVGLETLRSADPEVAIQIERRAQSWIEEHGSAFPGDPITGVLGNPAEDLERFAEFANHAACPALDPDTGRCGVYAFRPMTCRAFGPPVRMGEGDALGHCELCFQGATDEAIQACEMSLPHELEATLLAELDDSRETVVAFALVSPRP
jgi:Fe-S-cluster containining protein